MTSEAVASTMKQALLGEGLRWDSRRDELLAVDIIDGRVYRARVVENGALSLLREYWVPGTVGAIAPVDGDDGWVMAAGRGFVHLRAGRLAPADPAGGAVREPDERRRLRCPGPVLGGSARRGLPSGGGFLVPARA